MKKLILLLVMFSNHSFGFDFKGVELNSKVDKVDIAGIESKLNARCGVVNPCNEPTGCAERVTLCSGTSTLIGRDVSVHVWLEKDIVSTIHIDYNPNDFDSIKDALVKKFGKPKSVKKSILGNAMGAKFNQVELRWEDKVGVMSFDKYSNVITKGTLNMITFDKLNEYVEQIKAGENDL